MTAEARAVPFWAPAEIDAAIPGTIAQLEAHRVIAYPTETVYGLGSAIDSASDLFFRIIDEQHAAGSARSDHFAKPGANDRIGIVAFAGRPYLVSPLTLDHDWLIRNLERLRIGLVEDGTAIGSAIASAANRLKDKEAKTKLIVLLTDGDNNAGKVQPLTAAEAATIIFDGVRAGGWRILVGEDAKVLDEEVRRDPKSAYEPAFVDKLHARGQFLNLVRPAN